MSEKSKPVNTSGILSYLDAYSVAPARPGDTAKFLDWLAEIAWLSEIYGAATPALWHEVVRGRGRDGRDPGDQDSSTDGEPLSRASSNRQWNRLKNDLVSHGVPHERVKVESQDEDGHGKGESMVGIRITVPRTRLEQFAFPLKKCMRKACPAHEKPIPARAPWFYRNARAKDGLDSLCAACRLARQTCAQKKKPQARTHKLKAAHRAYNASDAGRARTRKHRQRRRGHDIVSNEFHASAKSVYSNAVAEFMDTPRAHEMGPAGVLQLSRPQQHSGETNFMPAPATTSVPKPGSPLSASPVKSTGELIKCLNALGVLGDEKVTERRLAWLLAACPELEPPRVGGHRMFGPVHEAGIRAAFEARRKADEGKRAARAARRKGVGTNGAPAA